jgi:hypothetical protein
MRAARQQTAYTEKTLKDIHGNKIHVLELYLHALGKNILILQVICRHASLNHTERYQQQTTTRRGIISTRPTRTTLFATAVLEVAERG